MFHNNLESESTPPVLVSTLSVHLESQSKKRIDSIIIRAGDIKREIHKVISPGDQHQELFDPPLGVLVDAKFSVSVHCHHSALHPDITFEVDPKADLLEAEKNGKQAYCETKRNVEITIGVQSLQSTVKEIIGSCSRFRLLLIGKSGVGKSSLINKTFGVSGVDVSDTTRGQADIDREYVARDNERFVVHDSCGFEAGDRRKFQDVNDFISKRRRMRNLKDHLHAVWLCLEIPFAGGRLIETGVEEFLRDREDVLGDIPLIVVLTKVDELENMLNAEALSAGEFLDGDTLNRRKSESLERLCLAPLRVATGNSEVPYAAVSVQGGYDDTLNILVGATTRSVQRYIKDESAHCIATIAQRVSITLKVAATIAIGEKRYWKALRSSPYFQGHTMKDCLDVLHNDIVAVWNFKDPENYLYGLKFREMLLKMPDFESNETQDAVNTLQSGIGLVTTLVSIISSVAGTASSLLPIVVPIAGAAILCKLAFDWYKNTQAVVRRLMAYIIDVTSVMQILFLLTSVRYGEVTEEAVSIAMKAYEESHRRAAVHTEINVFRVHLAAAPGKRDDVLEKIKELIEKFRVPDENILALRRQLK